MKKRIIIGITAIFLIMFVIVFSGCTLTGRTITNTHQEETIKIGAILCLTGVCSNEGIAERQGIDMAVDEINSNGGVLDKKLEVIYQDTPSDSTQSAVSAINFLMQSNINIIIGTTWSPSALAVAPIACDNKILMIAPSVGVREFNERCEYIFNMWMHDEDLSKVLGKKIYDDGYRRLAILGSQQFWEETQAKAVRDSFREAGGDVVAYELPTPDQNDFRTNFLKIKESKPDAIYLQYSFQDIAAKTLQELNINIPIYLEVTDKERMTSSKGALEGAIVVTQKDTSEAFTQSFIKKYGTEPDIGADSAYDSMMMLAKAMKESGSTNPDILKDKLSQLKEYNGASGKLISDGKRGVIKIPKYKIIINSTLVDI